MMNAEQIMTAQPACCTPDDSIREVARLLKEQDCGCIPVIEDRESRKLVGVVTDRDLVCRGLAEGKGADALVRDVASFGPSCCAIDDDVEDVERIMAERQVRRVPVIDADGCCVGIISQADLVRARGPVLADREVIRVIERVSEPLAGSRRETPVGRRPDRPNEWLEA